VIVLASQPTEWSRICSARPRQMLGCWTLRPSDLGFLYQRFSSLLGDEACQFRNQQSRTWSFGVNHGSIWDSWPMAFSGYPRGPRVACETWCPKHAAPNLSAETRSRTRVSREPHGHRQRNPQHGAEALRNTQAVCGFRCWASKLTPLFHTISTMVAIFLARVRRAISGRMPLVSKAV
jgi:hypothetical protein